MAGEIHSVNHVGMAVRDMAKTAARYEAMGFLLTPFSLHAGAWKPGDAVAKLAYGNRCVMFDRNYLEILASERPEMPSPRIAGFLARHQGAHIICFGTEDPDGVHARLESDGMKSSGVLPLQREIETPEGMRTARFVRVQLGPDTSPEGFIQAARHLTPQYIHQPRFIAHPNRCVALSEVFLVTDDPRGFEAKYARYCARTAETGFLRRSFSFPLVSKVSIVAAQDASRLLPGSLLAPPPCIAGIAMQTLELDAVRRRLREAAIAFQEREGVIIVPAEEAMGIAIIFEERGS
jgi:hypothetical protein